MGKTLVYVGVIVLAVIAVVLGYQIYQQTAGVQTPSVPQTQDTTVPQTVGNQDTLQISPLSQKIDMEFILKNTPDPNSSIGKKQDWENYLRVNRQEGSLIVIKNCIAEPSVLIIENGEDFKIQNEDSVDHKLTIPPNGITVKAKESVSLKATLEMSEFGYSCETIPNNSNVGIVHVLRQ